MFIIPMLILGSFCCAYSQSWQQNDNIFNPSGIPSLSFSQPRFADLDNDGDQDMILGSISDPPKYYENSGSPTNPHYVAGADIFNSVLELDCEVGVCVDLDNDGDLDFIAGGYSGITLYDNSGTPETPLFVRVDGFFSGLELGANPIPDLADMDADGDQDLVVGYSEGGEVRYYQNIGTPDQAIFLQDESEDWFDVGLYAYPWFADLDLDGDTDLLIGRDGYGFYYYRNAGDEFAWTWTDASSQFNGLGEDSYWNSPCLIDLSGDDLLDLVFGTAAGPLNYYVNTGTASNAQWQSVPSLFGGVLDVGGASNPVFIDFDGDADFDLLSGSQMGDIKYYENTGTASGPAWTANHSIFNSIDHSIYSAVTAGDLNGDGLMDLVVGDLSGNLFFHRNNGSGFTYDSDMFTGVSVVGWSSPRLYDFDSDSDLDLFIGDENGGISFYENTGDVFAAEWLENPSLFGDLDVGSNAVFSIGDINLDRNLDIIMGNLFNEIRCFTYVFGIWVEHPEYVEGITASQNATPALVDINGDGDLDLGIGNYDGTFNYYENLAIVAVEESIELPQSLMLINAYPNPFNPQIYFSVELHTRIYVSLEVYDLNGRMVKSIAKEQLDEGIHRYNWDATDSFGNGVETGVYFVVLKSHNNSQTQKILYLK